MSSEIMISKALPLMAKGLEHALREVAGERVGFVLLTFPIDRPGTSNYISNCDREDMRSALANLLQRWDEGMPNIPAHMKN